MTRAQRIALAMAGYPVKKPLRYEEMPLGLLDIAASSFTPHPEAVARWNATHNRASILVSSPKGIPCA